MREMKDSGVEWIGEIPADWEICRLKDYAHICNGCDYSQVLDENGIYPVIGSGGQFAKASEMLCAKESVLLGRKGTIDKPLFINQPFWTVDTMYYTEIKENVSAKFFYYLCTQIEFDFYQYGSAVPSMTKRDLNSVNFPYPTLNEQCRIADYLDHKCAKIDAIIARQQQVIEKLKAYKLSVITEAVTRGLNPDVPMKDSGIEWIGSTPIDWQVLKFGLAAHVSANLVSPVDYLDYPQISPESVEKDSGRILGHKTVAEAGVISWNHLFVRGQILYSKIRPLLNKVAIAPFDGLCSADMYPIDTENDSGFIAYVMRSCYFTAQVGLVTENRVKMPKINQSELSKIMITLPPLKEQVELAEYLDKKCKGLDHIIERKQALIDKLTEYKKSLIYEVVTGKREITEDLSSMTGVVVLAPALIAELREKRAALMTRFIDGLGDKNKGRVQIQKCMFLAEGLIDLQLGMQFARKQYGPYDEDIQTYEQIMAGHKWMNHARKKGRIKYTHGKRFQEYHSVYQRFFGNYDRDIQRIIDFVKPIKRTSEIGRMATLFAAWNDFILDGIPNPTDEQIISEVCNNWTENKANTPVETWQDSLNKLRAAGMIPHGYGRHTVKLEEGDRTHG